MAISSISVALHDARTSAGLSQRELADAAGTAQSVVARIERDAVSPTIATLERLARAAGCELELRLVPAPVRDPVIEAYKKDVDRTLLRENIQKSVEMRLQSLCDHWTFAEELKRAGKAMRTQSTKPKTRPHP